MVFGLLLVFYLMPWASPPVALALGLVLAQTLGNPFVSQTKVATAKLLQYSVVGLGFGMNAHAAMQAGRAGILFTVWIIPVSIATAVIFKQKGVKIRSAYFIFGFIAAMLLNTYVPTLHPLGPVLVALAKIGLTVMLFFIGAGLSAKIVRSVGARPYLLGVLLWVVISSVSLCVILHTV